MFEAPPEPPFSDEPDFSDDHSKKKPYAHAKITPETLAVVPSMRALGSEQAATIEYPAENLSNPTIGDIIVNKPTPDTSACNDTHQRILLEAERIKKNDSKMWTAFVENTDHKFDPIFDAAWKHVEKAVPVHLFPTPARELRESVNNYVMAAIEDEQGNKGLTERALLRLQEKLAQYFPKEADRDAQIAILDEKIAGWIKNPPSPALPSR